MNPAPLPRNRAFAINLCLLLAILLHNLTYPLSGAGGIDAGALAIDDLIADGEGAGDHVLRAVKSAAITSRGIGKTVVLGRPTCTVRNIGSGSVTCGAAK